VRFAIPETVLARIHAWRAERGETSVEREHRAFCIDGGLGPAWYLTLDGVVLRDGVAWDEEPIREATDAEAFQAIVVGAKRTGIAELLDVLPPRPPLARTCARCGGERYASAAPEYPEAPRVVCGECSGLGWTAEP
jgi:hypothetical protein